MSESHSQLANRLRGLSVDELCAVILEANLNDAIPVMTRMVMGSVAAPIFAEALMSRASHSKPREDVLSRFREQSGGPVFPKGIGSLVAPNAHTNVVTTGHYYCDFCKMPAPDTVCTKCRGELLEAFEPVLRGSREAAYYCPDDVADDHTVLVSFTIAELRRARAYVDLCLSRPTLEED